MISRKRTFVAVVDKVHRDRVVWKTIADEGGYLPVAYRPLLAELGYDQMAGQLAILHYGSFRADGADNAVDALPFGKEHAAVIRRAWSSIAARNAAEDLELALWTADHNPDVEARRAALFVLANFLDRDVAWWSLIDALRDPVEKVRGSAGSVLYSALKHETPSVDWRPASRSIALLLNGTNIGAVPVVSKALVATRIDPKLAAACTDLGAHGLLAYVGAELPFAHDAARRLLERFTGQNHERDAAKWRAALAALRSDRPPVNR